MRRITLMLAMLVLSVLMALPATAQDGGLVIYDNGEWRGTDDPRDPQCGWYQSWTEAEEWWEYWCYWPNWGWEFVFWSW
jgi:hypothetical protein